MPADTDVKLTLSIWRDFEPACRLLRSVGDDGRQMFDSNSGLQQEVYSWRLQENVLDSIADDATRRRLREQLVDQLADRKPPDERRLEVLETFVDTAQDALAANAEEGARGEDNPLLALTIHLKWLLACFGDRPGISVSVR